MGSHQIQGLNFLQLQPLTIALLPAAVHLDQLCFGGLWSLATYHQELERSNNPFLALLTDPRSGSPAPELLGLGCSWTILEESHIILLAVHPSYRRHGLGQILLRTLLAQAHQDGLERATLEARVSNQAALNLYGKFGFRIAGRRPCYYQDTQEDALILWRNHLQSAQFIGELAVWEQQLGDRLKHQGWHLTVRDLDQNGPLS